MRPSNSLTTDRSSSKVEARLVGTLRPLSHSLLADQPDTLKQLSPTMLAEAGRTLGPKAGTEEERLDGFSSPTRRINPMDLISEPVD